jgi:hypothetical protein
LTSRRDRRTLGFETYKGGTMRRLSVALGLGFAVLMFAAIASAAAPTKESNTFSDTFVDTDTCPGVTINGSFTETDTIITFSATSVQIHVSEVVQLSANGKTVIDNDHFTIMLDPTTTVNKYVGTVFNIQAPGVGNLLVDAGNIIFDFSTDPSTVIHIGGPHPAFFGDVAAFCAYLADP